MNPYLRSAMNALHMAMEHEKDPQIVAILSGCQHQLAKAQQMQMQPKGGGGQAGPSQQQPESMPSQGGVQGGDPRAALLSALAGGR